MFMPKQVQFFALSMAEAHPSAMNTSCVPRIGTVAWLDKEHCIAPAVESLVRQILAAYRPKPIMIVPTHGDWQPRNWLIDEGNIRVIDFGRFDRRPPATDLCRLAAQQWKEAPELEAAFLDGYGSDPR